MYDAVVIGLGGVGSFALRSLSMRGAKVLGVERFALGHSKGSSHGRSRIYRRAYFEHEHYVPWIEYSLQVIRNMNPILMHDCGMLLMAPTPKHKKGDESFLNLPQLLASSHHSAVKHKIEVEFLSNTALQQRYPQFTHTHNMVGLLEPQAGMMRPERVMQAAIQDCHTNSDTVITQQTQVLSMEHVIDQSSSYHVLKIRHGEQESLVETRKVLIAAGAWTSELVPEWAHLLEPTRQVQGWIDVAHLQDSESLSADKFPAWYMETPDWPIPVYGLPWDPQEPSKRWIKVSVHGRECPIDPFLNSSNATEAEQFEIEHAAITALQPHIWAPGLTHIVPCMYTMTPDKHFLIGSPSPNVFCVCGLSGHGFKMTPALGQIMADYAMDQDLEQWNVDFCSPKRFGIP